MKKTACRLWESLKPTDEEVTKGVIFTDVPERQCHILETSTALGITLGGLNKLAILEVLVG